MISHERVEGNWNELKGRVRETWGDVTDDDLQKIEGQTDRLIGMLQEKTGQAREQIERELNRLLESGSSAVHAATENLRDVAGRASETVSEKYEQVSGKLRDGYGQAETMVQRRPTEAVAVAFGTGLIAGVVVGLVLRSR